MVGADGAGTPTLLKILVGAVTLDGGAVTFGRGARVGELPQNLEDAVVGAGARSTRRAALAILQACTVALEALAEQGRASGVSFGAGCPGREV
jgi:ATPase subunit of ABC transporter with duplicated ATPase domains